MIFAVVQLNPEKSAMNNTSFTSKLVYALISCCILFMMYGCQQKSSTPFPLNYTSKMGGIRHWSGVTIRDILDTSGGTTTIHIDSVYINDTFAIKIINDKTIEVPNFLNV